MRSTANQMSSPMSSHCEAFASLTHGFSAQKDQDKLKELRIQNNLSSRKAPCRLRRAAGKAVSQESSAGAFNRSQGRPPQNLQLPSLGCILLLKRSKDTTKII